MKKEIKFEIIKYTFFLIFFCLLQNIRLFGYFNPFPFGVLFALAWCKQNIWNLSAIYLVSSLIVGINLFVIVPVLFTVCVLILCALIHKRINKKINMALLTVYACISQVGKFILIQNRVHYLINIAEIFAGIIIMIAVANFFQAVLIRKARIRLNMDEIVCGYVTLLAFACGLSALNVFSVNIGLLFAIFLILLSLRMFGLGNGMVVSSIMALGYFFCTGLTIYFASFCLLALFAGLFISTNKYLSVFSLLSIEAVLGFYFSIYSHYSYINYICVALGCLLFLCISDTVLKRMQLIFNGDDGYLGKNCLIEVSRHLQYYKLNEISRVLQEMDIAYKKMLKKTLTKQEACFMLAEELCSRMCNDCPNKQVCYRKSGEDMLNHFYNIFNIGLNKKQIKLIDIPVSVHTRCDKLNLVINGANSVLNQYLQYDSMINGINTSRLLISDQMGSVSKVLKRLALSSKEKITYSHDLEKNIMQSLIYKDCTSVVDAVVIENENEYSVIISCLEKIDNISTLERIVSDCCRTRMELKDTLKEETTELISYYFINSPKCDMVFGSASTGKSGTSVSGDVHGVIKLNPGKFLLAVCDGMGSGESASEISNQTINLIENYYKAGFESESIIDNINKLFIAGNEEKFSAVDICVLDLFQLQADFIKLGAPFTLIKRGKETQVIEGGTLPIGAVSEINPKLEKRLLNPKDIIFLMSDGITENFETKEVLATYINGLKSVNPQDLAEEILKEAIRKNNGVASDDMTVFVSRVFSKV